MANTNNINKLKYDLILTKLNEMKKKFLQVLKRTAKIKILFLSALLTIIALQANAQSDIVYNFDAGSKDGWGGAGANVASADGKLEMITKDAAWPLIRNRSLGPLNPALFSSIEIICMNTSSEADLQFQVLTHPTDNTIKTSYAFTTGINETGYTKRTIDLTSQTIPDNIEGIQLKLVVPSKPIAGHTPDTVYIESITLVAAAVTTHDLTVTINGGGSVTPGTGAIAEGVQDIEAFPFLGWEFDSWGDALSGSTNPTTINMDANKSVTATFNAIANFKYTWNFSTGADLEGWTPKNNNGMDVVLDSLIVTYSNKTYGGIISPKLQLNHADYSVIQLAVVNNTGVTDFQLINFDESALGDNNAGEPVNIEMPVGEGVYNFDIPDHPNNNGKIFQFIIRNKGTAATGDLIIKHIKLPETYDLTTSVSGNGTINPSSGSIVQDSIQSIMAIPFIGYEFTGWGGALSGTTNPTTITMDTDKSVSATFAPIANFNAYEWNFNTDGNTENWTNIGSSSTIASGSNTIAIESSNAKIENTHLAIPTNDYAALEIRLKNLTNITGDSIYPVKINAETASGASYRKLETMTNNDAEFKTYQVTWTTGSGGYEGDVIKLQVLTPNGGSLALDGSESIEIDYIKWIKKQAQSITFNSTDNPGIAAPELGDTVIVNKLTNAGLTIKYESSDSSIIDINNDTLFVVGLGSATITASQAGDPYYYQATNVDQTITVGKQAQTITFNALAAKVVGDSEFDLAATASSGLAVSYAISDENVATVNGNTVTIVGAGTATITASQAGDATYGAATTVEQALVVNKADQTITFDALEEKEVGDAAFDLTASASSGLDVVFASSDVTVATISGNTVTIVGSGSTNITASQAGDTNYNAAIDVQQQLLVTDPSLLNQTITFDSLPAKTIGDSAIVLSATASSGLAVVYTSLYDSIANVNGDTITIIGAGTTTITASQPGDSEYNAAPNVSWDLVVNKLTQTISFDSLPEKTIGDAAFKLTAKASSNLEVTYTCSDTTVAKVVDSTVTLIGAGTATIIASQAGNNVYSAATSISQTLVVNPAAVKDQTITFDTLPAKNFGDLDFELIATATSKLEVSFISSDATIAQVSGTTVSIVGVGSAIITASQAGNNEYNPAADVEQVLVVNKADQTIAFDVLEEKTIGDAAFNLSATASSGLTVAYTSSDTTVATIVDSTVTIVGAGIASITASQSGNMNYNAALDIAQQLIVNDTVVAKITSTPVINATVSSLYTYSIDTVGVATLTFASTDTSGWLTLNKGVLSGTPTTIDTVAVTLTYGVDTQAFEIIIVEPVTPEIISTPVTKATVGTLYTYNVETVGDDTLKLSTEATWLSLADGVLNGTPTSTDAVEVTLTYGEDSQIFTITVGPEAAITSTPVTDAKVGVEYIYTIETVGEATLELTAESNWLTLTDNVLSGTPTTEESVSVTLTYGNDEQVFDILVGPTAINLNSLVNMNLFPNPATQYVTLSNIDTGSEVYVYNVTGKLMLTQNALTSEMRINTSVFEAGVYFVKVVKGEIQQSRKLIIK